MEPLQYKVVKTITQYNAYCDQLEALVVLKKKTRRQQDTIELLTLLIKKWDDEHNTFADADPIGLLTFLMKENNLKSIDLANTLEVSKSLISDILHYRRALSREIIRKLADRLKVSQELFNRPYELAATPKKIQRTTLAARATPAAR